MSSTVWRLDAIDATLLLQAQSKIDVPSIIWFGDRLPADVDKVSLHAITDLPLPMAKLDESVPLSLFPQRSTGTECSGALRGHNSDGSANDHRFKRRKVTERVGGVVIELHDEVAALEISISLSLHSASGVLSVDTTLVNKAVMPYTIDWLASATIPFPYQYAECMHLFGRWGLEFQTERATLGPGRLTLHSHRGRTSHEHYPGVVVGEAGFTENMGDVMAANLAWSGSHSSNIELLSDGSLYYQTGVSLDPGELQLAEGESFSAPTCFLSRHRRHGINAVSQSMHEYLRSELLPSWTRYERPVHANSWEALYFNHDIDSLLSLVDSAAGLGAERFILDDGWFLARRSDQAGLGDWKVDASIYPQGLHPLVEHVRSRGMQFGLWFEPEMVNPDSELYRRHPHWALHQNGIDTPLARNQLVLNVDNPKVFDYLYEHIAALVIEYKIDYIKWDHNRDLVLAGDGERSRMLRQTSACYRLMDKLNTEFDWLEIESCSSGGARADWGILKYTGRIWTSDSIDAIDRAKIQRGFSYFNPPEIMGAHVGHAEAHLTGREIDIHTRAIVSLQGQFGYEVDARKLTSQEKQTLKHYVTLYKVHRPWISTSKTWRLDATIKNLIFTGLVSANQKTSLWFVVAVDSLPTTTAGPLVLKGLLPDAMYQVSLASTNKERLLEFTKKSPQWFANGVTTSGALLMSMGLMLPIMPAQSALLVEAKVI